MWKWILGTVALIIVLLAWRGVVAYKRFTAGGNEASVTIAAPAARVFASLANADSLSTWMVATGAATTARKGALEVGDQIHVESRSTGGSRVASYDWLVREVRASDLLVFEMRSDRGRAVAMRRDSLVSRGDSTVVTASVSAPMLDSVRAGQRDSGRTVRGGIVGVAERLLIAAFRTDAQSQLLRLKARVESK